MEIFSSYRRDMSQNIPHIDNVRATELRGEI